MRRAEAAIAIDAPAELVWAAMLDLGSYRLWNPFVVQIDGPAGREPHVGDDITLQVRFRGGRSVTTRERITDIRAPAVRDGVVRATFEYEFRGPLRTANVVRARRLQTLRQQPGTRTLYRTEETFRGMLAVAVPLAGVQDGFRRHALALKARAEALHRVS